MKAFNLLLFAIIISLTLVYASCKKEETAATPATTVVTPTVDTTTVFSNNTTGYIGGSILNANISFFGVQGDSTGYMIQAAASSNIILIKTGSANFPATLPAVGNYNIYNLCDTCSHTLLPNEALAVFNTMATSGTINVAISNNKYVYTFKNIPVKNSTQKWSGKLVSP
jgi:hypothetical protein